MMGDMAEYYMDQMIDELAEMDCARYGTGYILPVKVKTQKCDNKYTTEYSNRRKKNMIEDVKLKVVGVSFTNEDGTNRQAIISTMKPDSTVMLRREPGNKFDINAIAVDSIDGQVGYIGKDYAKILAPLMDKGTKFSAKVDEVDCYKNTHYIHIIINEVG